MITYTPSLERSTWLAWVLCCGRPRVASKVCLCYSVPRRVALAATDCHPLCAEGAYMAEPTPLDYAPPERLRNPAAVMLLCSFAMAFLFAVIYVIVMTLSLPPSDGAYGQTPFQDPLVLPIMAIGASMAAVVVFPFFYFTCRYKRLGKSVTIVASITVAELLLITPFDAGAGFVGSFLAFAVGLAFAGTRANQLKA